MTISLVAGRPRRLRGKIVPDIPSVEHECMQTVRDIPSVEHESRQTVRDIPSVEREMAQAKLEKTL